MFVSVAAVAAGRQIGRKKPDPQRDLGSAADAAPRLSLYRLTANFMC
jgi:hypothetical protein